MCHNQTGSQLIQNLLTLFLSNFEDLLFLIQKTMPQPKLFTKLVQSGEDT